MATEASVYGIVSLLYCLVAMPTCARDILSKSTCTAKITLDHYCAHAYREVNRKNRKSQDTTLQFWLVPNAEYNRSIKLFCLKG